MPAIQYSNTSNLIFLVNWLRNFKWFQRHLEARQDKNLKEYMKGQSIIENILTTPIYFVEQELYSVSELFICTWEETSLINQGHWYMYDLKL